MSAVFMAPSGDAPRISPETAPISVALKLATGRKVILAANRGPGMIETELNSSSIPEGRVNVLHENRAIQTKAGRLKDRFEAYQVHIYQWGE
jgi:hypothetical protein